MTAPPDKTKVHALLIGINDYREDVRLEGNIVFPKLHGCVNDAKQMLGYLQSDPSLELQVLELYNQEATRPAIINAFNEHLAKAGKGEVAFLFYSGHGAVEQADESIWQDPRLECLVCHYKQPHAPDFLLADKELRILLKDLYDKTQAHIVTIFDCCHSGDNTRELAAALDGDKAVRKQIDHLFPAREWGEFLFSNRFVAAQFAGKSMNEVIPQAPHIQIAAAERDEAALEVNGSGVLTTFLLQTLRSCAGHLSYRDLHSRMRNQLKYRYAQKPKIYSPDSGQDLLSRGFLNKDLDPTGSHANLVYNKARGWRIDRGSLHGVTQGVTAVHLEISGEPRHFVVGAVEIDAAQVPGIQDLDKNQGYLVKLGGLTTPLIRIQLVNKDFTAPEFAAVADALACPVAAPFIALEDAAERADYSLVLWQDKICLTRPGDCFRPLFRPVRFAETGDDGASQQQPEALAGLLHSLRHIAGWTRLRDLNNDGTGALGRGALEVSFRQVMSDGTEREVAFDERQSAVMHFEPMPGSSRKWGGKVRIGLRNTTSDTKLHVAVLYASADFSVSASLLEPQVSEIEPGRTLHVREHKQGFVRMAPEDHHYWYDVPSSTDTLKVIVSTEPFETTGLTLEGLPAPWTPDSLRRAKELESRGKGLQLDEEEKPPRLEGWQALTFHLDFRNPQAGQVSPEDILQMLEAGEELAHFATGLYFRQEGLSGRLVPGVADEAAPKSLLWEAALALANKHAGIWRHRHYHKMRRQHPQLPLLLSEGDSWFQHPLLKDLIDYVGEKYPVYCLAEAGDTIANYLKEAEMFKALAEEQPGAFLLSGGGNDILGSSMRGFLNAVFADAPEGQQPERFFNDNFGREIEKIMQAYRSIFEYVQRQYPQLKVFVHGYDYPKPLPAEQGHKGWIGRYLTEFGILRHGDRQAAVNHMMDLFNLRLSALALRFPGQVVYTDLRRTVQGGQWNDEIHPTDEGYQELALKLMGSITCHLGVA